MSANSTALQVFSLPVSEDTAPLLLHEQTSTMVAAH